jgi:hypothetical protein
MNRYTALCGLAFVNYKCQPFAAEHDRRGVTAWGRLGFAGIEMLHVGREEELVSALVQTFVAGVQNKSHQPVAFYGRPLPIVPLSEARMLCAVLAQ